MALKVTTPYSQQPVILREVMTADEYLQEAEHECHAEYTVMDQCFKSEHVADCYGIGSVQYGGAVLPCVLIELSELGNGEHYSVAGEEKRGLSDDEAQRIVRQLAMGLTHMHQMANTLHRDVKLSSLLLFGSLEAPTVKLCDFGTSR